MTSRGGRALSFGAVAEDYDRWRPGPPPEALDWLVPERCEVAVDLAAGTGLLARALVRVVPRVVAIEPDGRMATVMARRSPAVEVVRGRGEDLPLQDASVDGLFVSSAWHWLDPESAVPEVARVLRDGGRFGVLWTGRDRRVDWVGELDHPEGTEEGDAAARAAHRRRHRDVTLPPRSSFAAVDTASFTFTRPMTVAAVAGMLSTYSGVITAGPYAKERVIAHAHEVLARRFPGAQEIDVPMRAWCWRADRLPRPTGGARPSVEGV